MRTVQWRRAKWRAVLLSALLPAIPPFPPPAPAQEFTRADSGWVPLFNGRNFDGLYSRMYKEEKTDAPDEVFQIVDGSIKVSPGKGGHIGTDGKYSHYRVRVEYRFDRDQATDNAGLMYHVDESVPRMRDNWSRSIECQMRQGETGSAFSIQQATFSTRTEGKGQGSKYDPGGVSVNACEHGCDGRSYRGNPLISGGAHWNLMEVIVRGADSAVHRVNGTTVFRLRDIRIFNASDGTPDGPYKEGHIALQAEGAGVAYRNWEIMELPAEGPDYLHRFFLTGPGKGESLVPGSLRRVTWKTIGKVDKVKLEYDAGSGWTGLAENVDNTGGYDWRVPAPAADSLRLRISGPAWALPDSSRWYPSATVGIAGRPGAGQARAISVKGRGAWHGKGAWPRALRPGARLEIRDARGRRLRSWDPGRFRDAGERDSYPGERDPYEDWTVEKAATGMIIIRPEGAPD